ncbi:MAG: hypothetical protein SWK76_15270 [Actinomycetota bacterium]|nr:hypothetical protein [Actinomycetota bacterium]
MAVIESLVLEVDSLQATQGLLAQNGLLGEVSGGRASVDPTRCREWIQGWSN